MNTLFTKLEKEMKEEYFPALVRTGVGGVVVPSDKIFSSNLASAKNNNLQVWVSFDEMKKDDAACITCDSSGISVSESKMKYLPTDMLKEMLNSLNKSDLEHIDGVIVHYPRVPHLFWDESFKDAFSKEFSNHIEDYLYLLLEPSEKLAPFRTWYYEKCAEFVFKNYLQPLTRLAKRKGIKLCFDIGREESEYFYQKRHIDILMLLEKGISVSVLHNTKSIAETCILLSKYDTDSFVVSAESDKRLDNLDINLIAPIEEKHESKDMSKSKILLVRATRGVSERMVKADISPQDMADDEAVIASFESTYYTDMLYEKGFDFEITSEKLFEKHTTFKNGSLTYKGKKTDQLLLCNSCVFSQKGIRLLNKIADGGICINNRNLINILASDLV